MTAENAGRQLAGVTLPKASMRPRPMTAENATASFTSAAAFWRFNEAAADDRGKLPRRRRAGITAHWLQ